MLATLIEEWRARRWPKSQTRGRASVVRGGEFAAAWRVLIAATVALPLCLMPSVILGVFLVPLSEEFAWSWSSISGLALFSGFGTIVGGPIEGRLIDTLGFRLVALIYIPLLACAVAAAGFCTANIWMLYPIMFAWGFVTAGSVARFVRAISSWFDVSRGKAIGVMFTAGGIGCALGPKLAQGVIERYGWRSGFFCVAAAVMLAWPLTLLWLHDKRIVEDSAHLEADKKPALTRREALRTQVFWYFGLAWFLSGLSAGGTFFLVPFLSSQGMTREAAATCLSILFLASAVVHPVLGYINDRWHPAFVAAGAFLLKALAFVLLALFGSQSAVLAAVLIGVGISGLSNSYFTAATRYFGLACFASISTVISSLGSAAGMVGPLLFSALQDDGGAYATSYSMVAWISVAAAGCMLSAGMAMARERPLICAQRPQAT